MYFKANEIGKAICKLVDLEPGNTDDFVVVEIDSKTLDAIQAKKQANGRYYVEILEKGGDPEIFSGNKIYFRRNMTDLETCDAFANAVFKNRKTEGFKPLKIMGTIGDYSGDYSQEKTRKISKRQTGKRWE